MKTLVMPPTNTEDAPNRAGQSQTCRVLETPNTLRNRSVSFLLPGFLANFPEDFPGKRVMHNGFFLPAFGNPMRFTRTMDVTRMRGHFDGLRTATAKGVEHWIDRKHGNHGNDENPICKQQVPPKDRFRKTRALGHGQPRHKQNHCRRVRVKDCAFPLPHLWGDACLPLGHLSANKGQKKHINFFNINFLSPTQNAPFWAPRKKVYVPLFLGKNAKKEDPQKKFRANFGVQKGAPKGAILGHKKF